MSTLSELGDLLELRINELTQASNLFLGSRPDQPDELLAVYQYPGGEPEYIQNQSGPNAERPQIQVVARAEDYNRADRLAHLAYVALASIRNATLGGTKYRSIHCTAPGSIGVDTNDRPLVAFNATVEKEVSLVS